MTEFDEKIKKIACYAGWTLIVLGFILWGVSKVGYAVDVNVADRSDLEWSLSFFLFRRLSKFALVIIVLGFFSLFWDKLPAGMKKNIFYRTPLREDDEFYALTHRRKDKKDNHDNKS